MIEAKVITDSVAPSKCRLTTFILTYPRFIHSEFMTHRMFSRNASSSRAIPTSKFIEAIKQNPAMPSEFTKNQRGMQATESIQDQGLAQQVWLDARDAMLDYVQQLSNLGVHKQHANRLLEPFQHINVVCTATDFDNFFSLRCHKDAQPEFKELAEKMWEQYDCHVPERLDSGDWHLPFVTVDEISNFYKSRNLEYLELLKKRSVARCARVSYNNHDGTSADYSKDVELYQRLVGNMPMHASPAEHQGMAIPDASVRSGNFKGWIQFRKTLNNENILEFLGSTLP